MSWRLCISRETWFLNLLKQNINKNKMNQTSKHKNEKKNAFVNTRSFKIFHFLSISKGGCPTPQVSVIIFQHCPLLSVFHLLCIASIEEKIYWTQQSNLYDFGNRKHSNVWINNNYLISSNYSQIMDGNAKITEYNKNVFPF